MPQPSQALSLSRGARSGSPRDPEPFTTAFTERLWLAVHLPHLVVEAVADPLAEHAEVVVEARHGRAEIVAANSVARNLGIRAGLTPGAARALIRSLEVVDRSPRAERERLEALAAWADALTPFRSVEPPDAVLLEIEGSLRLFGGVAPIKARVMDELGRRALSGRAAAAPTPLGALWLARAGHDDALSPEALAGRLGALPVAVTAWPEETCRLLAEMGIASLGDVLRLPRAGLARRIGRRYLYDLDGALGRRADPRAAHVPPPRYERCLELPAETHDAALLTAAIRRLLDAFDAHLHARQLQAPGVEIVLHHRRAPPTVHALRPARPVHRAERLLTPLALGLERLALPAACIAVSLRAEALEPLRTEVPDLFAPGGRVDADESSAALIENLQSRLGAGEVHGLALVAEHRPEKVWAEIDAMPAARGGAVPVSPWVRRRPLWLLREPVPLERALARFRFTGPLVFEAGPERIEAGWWDGNDVRRDYFIAATPNGERLWAYRDRAAGHWYLHGIFA